MSFKESLYITKWLFQAKRGKELTFGWIWISYWEQRIRYKPIKTNGDTEFEKYHSIRGAAPYHPHLLLTLYNARLIIYSTWEEGEELVLVDVSTSVRLYQLVEVSARASRYRIVEVLVWELLASNGGLFICSGLSTGEYSYICWCGSRRERKYLYKHLSQSILSKWPSMLFKERSWTNQVLSHGSIAIRIEEKMNRRITLCMSRT